MRRTDPDGLDVDELANAERRQFASVPTALDPTERQAWITGCHPVDEDATRLDPACKLLSMLDIARPEVATQAISGSISDRDGLLGIAHLHDRRDRPERLLLERHHGGLYVHEHGGRVEVARVTKALAPL